VKQIAEIESIINTPSCRPSSYPTSETLELEENKISDTGVTYNGPFHQVEMLPSTPFKNSMQVHLSQESKVVS
jgi:hypothetical protein